MIRRVDSPRRFIPCRRGVLSIRYCATYHTPARTAETNRSCQGAPCVARMSEAISGERGPHVAVGRSRLPRPDCFRSWYGGFGGRAPPVRHRRNHIRLRHLTVLSSPHLLPSTGWYCAIRHVAAG